MNQTNNNTEDFTNESVNLREEIEKYVFHWKWFLLGVIIALIGAFIYLRYASKKYEVATTILINDDKKGGQSTELSAFADLGLIGNSFNSIDNEIELLKSRNLMERVVKTLGINVNYYTKGRVKTSELFIGKAPIKINFLAKDSIFYKKDTTFTLKVTSPTTFLLRNVDGNKMGEHTFGEYHDANFGDVIITPTTDKNIVGQEVIVAIIPLKTVVNNYLKNVIIQPVNKKASVIKLSLTDVVKLKAKAILDNLVVQYNADAVEDKSLVAKNTNRFINERLAIITKELATIEDGAEKFKTKNKLTDITTQSSLFVNSNADLEKKIVALNTQLQLVDFMRDYLNKKSIELIPANLGLKDESLNASTLKYNELVLERNRIFKSSGKLNPIFINLEDQIAQFKISIFQSITNLKASLNIELKDALKQESRLNFKITSVPKKERAFRDIQRQQKIIEQLYLYLLEKREENSITLAVTVPNAKIIDKAFGRDIPVSPKRNIIYLAAILLGLLIPFTIIYLILLLDNKVHTSKEIEDKIKAPILGDIPKAKIEDQLVVDKTNKSPIAESFRMVRTMLNFLLPKGKEGGKTIFITSTIGGEGKTFIAINTASVLALSNKKVLLIGADIRNPKIKEYLKLDIEKGLTHYLNDENEKVSAIIKPCEKGKFDVIDSGIVAPNPSELLMNGRFEKVLEYGKANYDYVLVDTAPIKLVTDTFILGQNADLFIYVIRANYLDKRLLDVPAKFFSEKRLPNMAILVNGSEFDKNFGYGYGYGYGYGVEAKKPWWKKITG